MEEELNVNIKEISKRRKILQDLVDRQQACHIFGSDRCDVVPHSQASLGLMLALRRPMVWPKRCPTGRPWRRTTRSSSRAAI